MPFLYDFTPFPKERITTVEIHPEGWVDPIAVEYVTAQAHKYDVTRSVIWRVKGTSHCFAIDAQRLNNLSHGDDYKKHFTSALENFRKDYLSWFVDPEYEKADWKYEYRKQYGHLIIGEKEGEDNGCKN